MAKKRNSASIWTMVIAAVLLEASSCILYFTSRNAIQREAVQRAESELRKAELEINVVTAEHEAAALMLTAMAERYIDYPDSMASMTRMLLETMENVSSAGVAFIPNYYAKEGKWFEVCSSRDSVQGIYTREIGSADHDYLQTAWFQDGIVNDSCWWSEPYYDDSGAQAMIVSCTHPIRNGKGEIVGVTCIDVSLQYLNNISQYLQIYKDSYYSIRSNKGVDIVAIPDTTPGKKYYIFEEEIDATGWHMEIIIPDDVLYGDLTKISVIITLLMFVGLGILIFMLQHSARQTFQLMETTEQNKRMEGELHIARTIQMAMLPSAFPPFMDRLDLNIYGLLNPAKEIGGDLYDFYVRREKLFFCVGDVSGKGVPAALVMAQTRSLFRNITSREEEPDAIVGRMNKALADNNPQNMFLTLFLGVLDLQTGRMTYCNAGHNAPVIMQNGQWRMIDTVANLPLGIEPEFVFRSQETEMHYNDMLFLYTDGLTEAENRNHEQYGEKRMMQTINEWTDMRSREIIDSMHESVQQFVDGAPQSDDLTMLCVRYQTPAIFMRNDIEQIPTLSEWIDSLGLPEEMIMPVNLALEEAVSNVMLYAYPGTTGQLFVEYARNKQITFTITDNGIAFDPTRQKEADITASVEDRPIGGLGIHLLRQIMDEVRYERQDDKNILTLIKHI